MFHRLSPLLVILLICPPILMAMPRRIPSTADDQGLPFKCRPFCPASPGPSSNTLLITCADGPEGLALGTAILSSKPLRSQLAGVVAAVSSEASEGAEKLWSLGAEVRPMDPLGPGVFQGADWAFVLAPLTDDRLVKGRAMLNAAEAAGVPGAMLLSVIGAGEEKKEGAVAPHQLSGGAAIVHNTTTAIGALRQYWELEKHLWNKRWSAAGVVLRTYFYQQNLEFWAADVRERGGAMRLPLSGGFCPLHQADVAAVAVAIAREELVNVPSRFGNATFNLTGPQVLTGPALAAEASEAIDSPVVFENVPRAEAEEILEATGQLTRSEAELLLDLLELQPTLCLSPSSPPPGAGLTCPSPDVQDITGQPGIPVKRFFAESASSFRPSPVSRIRICDADAEGDDDRD